MSYATAVLTSQTNCASSFLSTVDGLLVAEGYTRVEKYPDSTNVGYVWKSPSASNSLGQDFYIWGYAGTLASTTPYFGVCEAYDSNNHVVTKTVPWAAGTIAVNQTDYTNMDTARALSTAGSNIFGGTVTVDPTSFTYWISYTVDRVHIATRVSTSDYGIFLGQTENMINETDHPTSAVSLAVVNGSGTTTRTIASAVNTYRCGWTREPGQTTTNTGNWSGMMSSSYGYPQIGGWGTYDSIYKASSYVVARMPLYSCRDDGSLWQPRALLPEGWVYGARFTTAVNGDTLSMNGNTYVHMTIGNAASTVHIFVDDSV